MNAFAVLHSHPYLLIGFVLACSLAAAVSPDKSVRGAARWGRFAAMPLVFAVSVGNLFQYNPDAPHAILNAGASWLVQVLAVGCVGYLIGASAFKLVQGGQVVVDAAGSVARDGVEIAKETVSRLETRICPHCAETIKARAVVCRFCGRDVGGTGSDAALADDEKFEAVILEIQARHPEFMPDHPDRDPSLEDEAILRMRAYVSQGLDRADALILAVRDMERLGAFLKKSPPRAGA